MYCDGISQVLDSLDKLLDNTGLTLRSGDSGPCLVTVVNSSRIQADITRDTRVLTGDQSVLHGLSNNVAGLENRAMVLVVLIPFREVPDRFTSQERSMMGQVPGCQLLLEMFVDTNNTVFFHCDHNNTQLKRIVEYFA